MSKGIGTGVVIEGIAGYYETGITGDGSEQDIPHGLARTPNLVIVQVDDEATATATLGTHDQTNLKVNVTSGKIYSVWALLARYPE